MPRWRKSAWIRRACNISRSLKSSNTISVGSSILFCIKSPFLLFHCFFYNSPFFNCLPFGLGRAQVAGARSASQHLHSELQHGLGDVFGFEAMALLAAGGAAPGPWRSHLGLHVLANGRWSQSRPCDGGREPLPTQSNAGHQSSLRGTYSVSPRLYFLFFFFFPNFYSKLFYRFLRINLFVFFFFFFLSDSSI